MSGSSRVRLESVVLDAADPRALATFYAALLERPISRVDGQWFDVRLTDELRLCIQHAPHHRAPTWPERDIPQQVHLDLEVDELDAEVARAMALGAADTGEPGPDDADRDRFRVLIDPEGHPFCLCRALTLDPDTPRAVTV